MSAAGGALLVALVTAASSAKPNIIFLLTDDQDTRLGSTIAMPQTMSLIRDQGANLSNFFIHTPICCPSRTTLLSGRYVHNNRVSTLGGGGCMRMNTSAVTNPEWWGNTLPNRLGQAGYTVGLFGKVLNTMTTYGCAAPYDTLPQNVDRLMIMCSVGYVDSNWADFGPRGLSNNSVGILPDYTTSVVGNASLSWIRSVVSQGAGHKPFFAYLGPHAPHLPSTPAPWYADHPVGNTPVPKDVYYNYSGIGKHSFGGNASSLAALEPIINAADEAAIAAEHGRRLQTLLSVDDIVGALNAYLVKAGEWENTFFITASDHGYSLGQFRVDSHKTQVWDHNTRIPVFARGPGIKPGSVFAPITSMVDWAPTILELAAGGNDPTAVPLGMDGGSFAPMLTNTGSRPWKNAQLIEYQSIRTTVTAPGPAEAESYISAYGYRVDALGSPIQFGNQFHAHDGPNNTFAAIRIINSTASPAVDLLYAEFFDVNDPDAYHFEPNKINFYELYDVTKDYYMLHNAWDTAPILQKEQLHNTLQALVHCQGGKACSALLT